MPDSPSRLFDGAVDWLMDWALAQDHTVIDHFWHICEGDSADCGCAHEGAAASRPVPTPSEGP